MTYGKISFSSGDFIPVKADNIGRFSQGFLIELIYHISLAVSQRIYPHVYHAMRNIPVIRVQVKIQPSKNSYLIRGVIVAYLVRQISFTKDNIVIL